MICFQTSFQNIVNINAKNAIPPITPPSTSCCRYQLSSDFSIADLSCHSSFWVWRYAGPELPSHCPNGCSIKRSMLVFMRSRCHLVEPARPIIAPRVPEYWKNSIPKKKTAKRLMPINCFRYFPIICLMLMPRAKTYPAITPRSALLEYVYTIIIMRKKRMSQLTKYQSLLFFIK